MAEGKNKAAIAASQFLAQRAIEEHTASRYHELGLSEEPYVHRR